MAGMAHHVETVLSDDEVKQLPQPFHPKPHIAQHSHAFQDLSGRRQPGDPGKPGRFSRRRCRRHCRRPCQYRRRSREWLHSHSGEWDLAVVDLFLQQGNGFGVVNACRDRAPHQKVVVLSNYATSDMRERSRALGADAFFDKSAEIDLLLAYCEGAHRA